MQPNFSNIMNVLPDDAILLIFKVLLLALIFVFILFSFIVISRVRTLDRTLSLSAANASAFLKIAAFLIFMSAISLFIITLVIV